MATRKGADSAARRAGTARSAHARKNEQLRNASFMVAPLRIFLSREQHGSTLDLARGFPRLRRHKPSWPRVPLRIECQSTTQAFFLPSILFCHCADWDSRHWATVSTILAERSVNVLRRGF